MPRSTSHLNLIRYDEDIVQSLQKYKVKTRIDLGMILLSVTDEDLVKLDPILAANTNFQTPTIKLSVYKNRRGRYKGIYLWCSADLGTCRIHPQFCTTWRHELIPIEDAKIIIDDEKGAF